jgi:hypothetical protein
MGMIQDEIMLRLLALTLMAVAAGGLALVVSLIVTWRQR